MSYLRCVGDADFKNILSEPGRISDQYFSSMLNSEIERQNLHLDESQQYNILKSIAKDMIELNYTAESREYLLTYILEHHSDILENSRNTYSADERPSKDELANKLVSHALLDRDRSDNSKYWFCK